MHLLDPEARSLTHRTDILLLAHAPLATGYARVAADMGLPVTALVVLDMPCEMTREQAFATARMLLADRPSDGCLVLVDLGGGASPFAVAQMLQGSLRSQVRVVAGLNTATLVTALCHSHLGVNAVAQRAAQRGAEAVELMPASLG